MSEKKWTYLILGLGMTGLSCARFLAKKGHSFAVMDSREKVNNLAQFKTEFPNVEIFLGSYDIDVMKQADTLVISPGISLYQESIVQQRQQGQKISSDIELFLQNITRPVIAITGSNGKSTVVTLLGEMAKSCQKEVAVGGNIGLPVLDLLDEEAKEQQHYDAYVLELSSFQLERLGDVSIHCGCVLNLSEDHMDRYPSFDAYTEAKHRIYAISQYCVYNRDDPQTVPQHAGDKTVVSFGLSEPKSKDAFGILGQQLVYGNEVLLSLDEIALAGRHNIMNAAAALACVSSLDWSLKTAAKTLTHFKGLPHRSEFVSEYKGVHYINDSKATNVGACLAAITGLGVVTNKNIVLIAGGDGKGADFSELKTAIKAHVRAVVLMGKDAPVLYELLNDVSHCEYVTDMQQAVNSAQQLAHAGDYVLMSPACASLDMYDNFEHRGRVFCEHVKALSLLDNNTKRNRAERGGQRV